MATKLFKIMGKFKGKIEQLDDTENFKEAEVLAREYRITLGEFWMIWIKESDGDEDENEW